MGIPLSPLVPIDNDPFRAPESRRHVLSYELGISNNEGPERLSCALCFFWGPGRLKRTMGLIQRKIAVPHY